MLRIAPALVIALTLAACDAVNTVTEGSVHARAVESDLEKATGVKPRVGFNWNNGRLTSVTVQYAGIVQSPISPRRCAPRSKASSNKRPKISCWRFRSESNAGKLKIVSIVSTTKLIYLAKSVGSEALHIRGPLREPS